MRCSLRLTGDSSLSYIRYLCAHVVTVFCSEAHKHLKKDRVRCYSNCLLCFHFCFWRKIRTWIVNSVRTVRNETFHVKCCRHAVDATALEKLMNHSYWCSSDRTSKVRSTHAAFGRSTFAPVKVCQNIPCKTGWVEQEYRQRCNNNEQDDSADNGKYPNEEPHHHDGSLKWRARTKALTENDLRTSKHQNIDYHPAQ